MKRINDPTWVDILRDELNDLKDVKYIQWYLLLRIGTHPRRRVGMESSTSYIPSEHENSDVRYGEQVEQVETDYK